MDEPLISVAALHALVYCERLFYLEEVERIRIADASVYAGRRMHVELEEGDDAAEKQTFESGQLGIHGTVDVLRRRDGRLLPTNTSEAVPPDLRAIVRPGEPTECRLALTHS